MLAEIGRGFSDNCVYSEQIYGRVQQLMNMASTPVLTSLSLALEGVEQCELYPFPLRDLFVGAPLLVAGKFIASRGFPAKIGLQGTLSDVSAWSCGRCTSALRWPCGLGSWSFRCWRECRCASSFPASRCVRVDLGPHCPVLIVAVCFCSAVQGKVIALDVLTTENGQVPVNKVFLKQRIDLLTARAWLEESKEIEAQIVALSVAESMPCAYTSMVAYETTPAKKEEQNKKDGKTETKGEEKKGEQKKKSGGVSAGTVAAVAVGGVIVLGAAAFAFGDVGTSTLFHAPCLLPCLSPCLDQCRFFFLPQARRSPTWAFRATWAWAPFSTPSAPATAVRTLPFRG